MEMKTWVAVAALLALLSAGAVFAAPTVWSQGFTNNVRSFSFPLLSGGDVYEWSGSSLSRVRSGLLYFNDFSSPPSDWRATSGTWSVSGGYLIGASPDPSTWGFYEYHGVFSAPSGGMLYFETKVVAVPATRGGLSLADIDGDTGDAYSSPHVRVTLAAKTDTGFEYAPPYGLSSAAVPPSSGDVWMRVKYITSGRYETFADVGSGWVSVHADSTSSGDSFLRLAVKGDERWSFDYIAVYNDTVVRFTGLPAGAVVQIWVGDRLVASVMADSSGNAAVDLAGEHLPLRNARVKVVVPPMTVCYTASAAWCGGASGRFRAVAGEPTVDVWYTVEFDDTVTLHSVAWIIPPRASVVNLTLVDGSTRTAYTPDSVSTYGAFKKAEFSFSGGASADKMILYIETPNIVEGYAVKSVDRDLLNPPSAAGGERMRALVNVSDGSARLMGARVALIVRRLPDLATLLMRTGSTGTGGRASLSYVNPPFPTLATVLAYYSPAGTEWYFGIAERRLRLRPSLELAAPSSGVEGEPVRLTARLHAGSRGIGGAEVLFQVRMGSSWTTIAVVETNSSGYAATSYVPPSSGGYRFRAVYAGDPLHDPAVSGDVVVAVKRVPVLAVSAPASARVGRPFQVNVTLSYHGSPLAAKLVVLERSVDGHTWTAVATAYTDAAGVARFTVTESSRGSYMYRARFAGDTVYAPVTSHTVEVGVVLNRAVLAVSVPSVNATCSAKVTVRLSGEGGEPLPGKTVTVSVNGEPLCTAVTDAAGLAGCLWIPPVAGTYTVEASFPGDERYSPASASRSVRVAKLSTRLSASLGGEAYVGREALVHVALTLANGTPLTGTVHYSAGPAGTGTVSVHGEATLKLVFPAAGNYTVSLSYPGDGAHAAASAALRVSVKRVPVIVQVDKPERAVEGDTVTVRVRVRDAFGGPVEGAAVHVYVGGEPVASGTTGSDGVAVLQVPLGAAGKQRLRVRVEAGPGYKVADVDAGVVDVSLAPWKIALPAALAVAAAALFLLWRRRRRRGAGFGAAALPPPPPPPPPPVEPPGEPVERAVEEGLLEQPKLELEGRVSVAEEEPFEGLVKDYF